MQEKNRKKDNMVIVITSGIDLDTPNFLQNLIKLLFVAFSGKIYVITSRVPFYKEADPNERIFIRQVMVENKRKKQQDFYNRIFLYILIQLKISYILAKEKKADSYVFFLAQSMFLPILTLRILKRKTILSIGASFSELYRSKNDPLLLFPKIEEKINFKLADHIILYSPCLIKQWHLEKYTKKIFIAHEHIIDFKKFKIITKLGDRDNLIGYIGRLSEEKGSMNFVKAISEISLLDNEKKILIGGDGPLADNIKKLLSENDSNNNVKFVGWIKHDELPDHLNMLKLLVIPSYTEGLPNIMLEAMACGTPILATYVGAIPDIIQDGETGFLMENNSPECIASNIIRALKHPDLEGVAKRAGSLIKSEFTFERTAERWKIALMKACDDV